MEPRQRRNEFNIRDPRCFPQHAHCLLSRPGEENTLLPNKQNQVFVEDNRVLNRSSTVNRLESLVLGRFSHLIRCTHKLVPSHQCSSSWNWSRFGPRSLLLQQTQLCRTQCKVKVISTGDVLELLQCGWKKEESSPSLIIPQWKCLLCASLLTHVQLYQEQLYITRAWGGVIRADWEWLWWWLANRIIIVLPPSQKSS